MILKALTLENFKGIREPVRVEFAPLTLLFGPNSSGKSTIIKALQLAKTVLDSGGADPFDLATRRGLELGSFRDCVNSHDLSKAICLTFEIELDGSPVRVDYDPECFFDRADQLCDELHDKVPAEGFSHDIKIAQITLTLRYDTVSSTAYVSKHQSSLNGISFGTIEYSPSEERAQISFLNFCHPLMINIDPQYFNLSSGNESGYDSWLRDAGLDNDFFPDEYAGNNSNTALEYFIQKNNEAPWEGKSFPFGIMSQKSAIRHAGSRMPLAIRKSLPRLADDSDPEMIRYRIACIIISDGFLGPLAALHDVLNHSVFLGPLRDIPSRQGGFQPSGIETHWSDGRAAWDIIINANEEFISDVNAWLSRPDRLDSSYGVDVVKYREIPLDHPIMRLIESEPLIPPGLGAALADVPVHSRVVLRDKQSGAELSLQDVGVGFSQLLPVVVSALYHESGSITREHWVSIEQPELHLHPALQVKLADLFVAQAQDRKKVFLLETHSEHLMLRCLRRIRETTEGQAADGEPRLGPEDIAVHFVEPSDSGPRIHRIRIDEDGEFMDPWPRGFFPERMKEIYGDDL